MDPEGSGWNVEAYMLAHVADLLAAGNWQRGNAGSKNPTQRPKPVPRPVAPTAPARRRTHDERVADWKARHCPREEVN
jgi:hypothetical protein